MMIWMRCLSVLFAVWALVPPPAQAQTTYPLTIGGYMLTGATAPPQTYNAGYSFYSTAWPLLGDYPRDNRVQTGLYGTWMFPSTSFVTNHYTDIEGGLGWWSDRNFQTATPKFIMGGVTAGGDPAWWFANSPGSGSSGGNGKYGIAQLSPSLLFPPDGLNLRQGTSGKIFGYGYLALPLTEPKTTTAGVAVPTGNHCWTLFVNSGNFKGPATFFTPYFWSQLSLIKPQLAGEGLDSRWAKPNKGFQMESQETFRAAAFDTAEGTFARSMPVYYPVDSNGYSLLMHRLCVYDQSALWNDVSQWLAASGSTPRSVIKPASTYVQTVTAFNPVWTMKNGRTSLGPLKWEGIVAPYALNSQELGYKWRTNQSTLIPSANGSLIKLPEYYQGPLNANSTSQWLPIDAESVPQTAATMLAGVNFSKPNPHNPVVAVDSDAVWTSPGPVSGACRALLGDGSYVTYYWYRFADQPALLKADMTLAERNRLQTVVEKMHREWKNDRDYIAPPTTGTLADLDPGQLLTPPLGLEYGYVPIAWRQDWGGSATSPGALNFTSVPATPTAGTSFSVTVQAVNTTGVAQNVTSDTLVQLSVASGYGTLSGTTVGTISSGSGSVTITGVIYSAADAMTMTASATCLSPGTSGTLNFTNSNGTLNLYNRPATALSTNLATLNATLDCRGTNADVQVYWGLDNGGTTPAGWANSASVGTWTNAISTNLSSIATGLLPETTYYFTFRGTNASGLIWASKVLSFTTLPLAPVITGQPVSRTSVVDSTASFTVATLRATGYQWYKGTVPLVNGGQVSGADTATLSLSGVTAANVGSYSVVIRNVSGQATSATASLTVVAAANLTWDANGSIANTSDGAGQWASNSWWNGTANVNWTDNNNVQIGAGGAGGVISLNEVVVNNLTLSNLSGTYTLSDGTLTVVSNLTFDTSASAELSSVIRGAGSLTKNGSGTLTLDGVIPNTYSGGTVINNGTMVWGTMVGSSSPECGFACGTGPVTLNSGGTIIFQHATPSNPLILNGGKLSATNGWGATWTGPVTVNSNTTVQPSSNITIFGDISGSGGFTKTNSGNFILGGKNTYRGATVVQAGKISWISKYSMSPGHLLISNGAIASLDYMGTRVIKNLTLGGVAMAAGTYGSNASLATNKNSTYFSGTGMVNIVPINVAPVAENQTVSTEKNTSIPIILTGTDANENLLGFSIVTQPTSGSISISGSNVIYNPATNYIGTVSFTFKANDGLLDSAPATVSITVTFPAFTWSSTLPGNWSDSTKWLPSNPNSTGADFSVLNFNIPATYTATHDLNSSFLLNQLNFGGSTLTLAGKSLKFVAHGAALPTINQNSGLGVMVSNDLNLGATTTFAGSGNGTVTVSGLVSGEGELIKNTPGELMIYGLVPNIYSGGTTVNNGTLEVGAIIQGESREVINPLGTGTVVLNGSSNLALQRVSASNTLVINGGTISSDNGWGATWSGPITLNTTLDCNAANRLNLSGAISGTGGLLKNGGNTLILAGSHSYSGNTTVTAGTLQLNSGNAGNNRSTLTIAASGATLNLNFVGTDIVNKLFIGGTQMAAGVYKAVGSTAFGTELANLTGTGTVTVDPNATTTTVASGLSPAPAGTPVSFTATVIGSAPTGNVSFYAGANLLGSSALNGSFQASVTTSSLAVGTYSVTASYAGNTNNSTSISAALSQVIAASPYNSWTSNSAQGLTAGVNNGPLDDPDRDSISNLMEFALGGAPIVSTQAILPTLKKSATAWVFEYNRSNASLSPATVQVVEYGNELTGWTSLPIPTTSAGPVTITPGSSSDRVSVAIPNGGNKTFVRLKVSQ